ncbi:hypothetical protein ACHQM5_015901 [Ranunculus cassubicifolius]
MAQQNPEIYDSKVEAADEHQDHGILDFLEKKEEENKPEDELSVPDFAKDHVLKAEEMKEEAEAEEHSNPTLPKQGLTEKIKEKITGDKTVDHEDAVEPEEKKSFMEKMKENLPDPPVSYPPPTKTSIPNEETEKKGFMEKIIEKLPGHHKDEADNKVE